MLYFFSIKKGFTTNKFRVSTLFVLNKINNLNKASPKSLSQAIILVQNGLLNAEMKFFKDILYEFVRIG